MWEWLNFFEYFNLLREFTLEKHNSVIFFLVRKITYRNPIKSLISNQNFFWRIKQKNFYKHKFTLKTFCWKTGTKEIMELNSKNVFWGLGFLKENPYKVTLKLKMTMEIVSCQMQSMLMDLCRGTISHLLFE